MNFEDFRKNFLKPGTFNFSGIHQVPDFVLSDDLILFTTSGTTGSRKTVAHSKEGFLEACRKSNQRFGINSKDTYGVALKWGYIARALAFGRALESGCKIADFASKWDPTSYYEFLTVNQVTVTSLVPTQLYDLVSSDLRAPSCLRLAFVSGGYLSQNVYEKARRLGWPVTETWGATETCGMIAEREGDSFSVFADVKIKISDGRLCVSGKQVAKYLILDTEVSRVADWLVLDDLVEPTANGFRWLGRADRLIKIKGHFVDLVAVEKIVRDLGLPVSVDSKTDERYSALIVLKGSRAEDLITAQQKIESIMPFLEGAIQGNIVDLVK